MIRKIATNRDPAGNLNVVYLNNQNLPCSFTQDSKGNWFPKPPPLHLGGTSGTPITIPNGTTIKSLCALGGSYGIVALDTVGNLWHVNYTLQNGAYVWNPRGFAKIQTNGLVFVDFDATQVQGYPVLIVAVTSAGAIYTQVGDPSNMPAPLQLNVPTQPGDPTANWKSIAAIGIQVFTNDPNQGENSYPSAVLCGATVDSQLIQANNQVPNSAQFAYLNPTGTQWLLAWPQKGSNNLTFVTAFTQPAGANLISLMVDASGVPDVYADKSGQGSNWNFVQTIQLGGAPVKAMATGYAGSGNPGAPIFIVAGITPTNSYLFTQDAAGNIVTTLQPQIPANIGIQLQDVAIGVGNQGVTQICYLGSDGNVYLHWQSGSAAWQWFGPLPR